MDVLITVLMKTHIYMRSLIMKDKEKKDLLSYLFVLSVSLFISSFFITLYRFFFFFEKVCRGALLHCFGIDKKMEHIYAYFPPNAFLGQKYTFHHMISM